MSVRLLDPAPAFGLVGKLPGAGDFLRLNLEPATASALDGWMQAGFAEPSRGGSETRNGPAWRVAMDAGVAGTQALAGVMTPSSDAVGRPYPCLALLSMAGAQATRLAAATSWFDAVEAALRSAVTLGRTVCALAAELAALGAPAEPSAVEFLVRARSTPDAAFLDVQGGPDIRGEALAAAWEATPPPEGSSLWWRHEGRRTQIVASAGLPRGVAFAALFPGSDIDSPSIATAG